jgi:hypothetical protein
MLYQLRTHRESWKGNPPLTILTQEVSAGQSKIGVVERGTPLVKVEGISKGCGLYVATVLAVAKVRRL